MVFGKLFGSKKPAPEAATPNKLSTEVATAILSLVGARSIPPMPGAAQKAFQLATDPSAEARDFIDVIESDEALSARVIKIANSVFFDRGKPSTTIEQSVLVIGINELRCLLNATTLSDMLPTKHTSRAQLWSNDIATALIARQLAQQLHPGKEEVAFLGGLMHDIGKLLLLQRAPELYTKIMDRVEREGCSFEAAEGDIFLFDHTEVGHLIAERWNFSPELIEMIRNHHRAWPDSQPGAGSCALPMVIKLADAAAHSCGLGHPRGFNRYRTRAEQLFAEGWSWCGLPEQERAQSQQRFQRSFESEFELYNRPGQ